MLKITLDKNDHDLMAPYGMIRIFLTDDRFKCPLNKIEAGSGVNEFTVQMITFEGKTRTERFYYEYTEDGNIANLIEAAMKKLNPKKCKN